MKHRMLPLHLAVVGLAGSMLLVQAPALADPGDDKKPKKQDLPQETECRDITSGTANYVRDRTVDDAGLLDTLDVDYPQELKEDSGTATLALVLAAPSCPSVTYTLKVFGADQQVLAITEVPGDGTSGTDASPLSLSATVGEYAEDCLMLVATTSVQGVVVDVAPDVVESYRDVCDGGTPGLTYK